MWNGGNPRGNTLGKPLQEGWNVNKQGKVNKNQGKTRLNITIKNTID
jgi:hypothetical protein